MKRSQPETSGTPPAKKQALTKMIPPVNIGAVSTEVSWQSLPFVKKIEFKLVLGSIRVL